MPAQLRVPLPLDRNLCACTSRPPFVVALTLAIGWATSIGADPERPVRETRERTLGSPDSPCEDGRVTRAAPRLERLSSPVIAALWPVIFAVALASLAITVEHPGATFAGR